MSAFFSTTIAVSYIMDKGTRISFLSMKDCSRTNLLSIDSTFPLNPFTDIIHPRLKGFVSRMKNPLKTFVKMSLAANPIVRPDILSKESSGFVSKPKVPTAERMIKVHVTQEHAFAIIFRVSGSETNIVNIFLKNASMKRKLKKGFFLICKLSAGIGKPSELVKWFVGICRMDCDSINCCERRGSALHE